MANQGPIVKKGAGRKRHRPVWSSTRVVLGQRTGGEGLWVDEDARKLKAVELDGCLQLTRITGFSHSVASSCSQAHVLLRSSTHRGARPTAARFRALRSAD